MRRQREHAARHFQADIAVDAGGNPDRAAAVGGVRDRHHAGGDHRRTARGGAAGGVVGVPGIAGDIDGGDFPPSCRRRIRRRRAPDELSPACAHLQVRKRVRGGGLPRISSEPASCSGPSSSDQDPSSGTAGRQTPVRRRRPRGAGRRARRRSPDDARQRRIDLADTGGGLSRQFRRGQLACPDAFRQSHAVQPRPLIPTQSQRHCSHRS